MSKFYDISGKISNSLPTVKISDDVVVTVNNRKSNMLLVKKRVDEISKRDDLDEGEAMTEVLKQLVGEKSAAAIEELDLPLPEYKEVYQAIMAAASGRELEDATFQETK